MFIVHRFHKCEWLTRVGARVVLEMQSQIKIPIDDVSFYLKSSSREFSQTSKCSQAGPSSLAISFPVLVQNRHWHHQRHHHQYHCHHRHHSHHLHFCHHRHHKEYQSMTVTPSLWRSSLMRRELWGASFQTSPRPPCIKEESSNKKEN